MIGGNLVDGLPLNLNLCIRTAVNTLPIHALTCLPFWFRHSSSSALWKYEKWLLRLPLWQRWLLIGYQGGNGRRD